MVTHDKRLIGILITVTVLLLIPFVAMQFSDEVDWSAVDFGIMASLLLSTGLACEFVIRKVKQLKYRIAICIAVLFALFLVWGELAGGIFGSPFAGS